MNRWIILHLYIFRARGENQENTRPNKEKFNQQKIFYNKTMKFHNK